MCRLGGCRRVLSVGWWIARTAARGTRREPLEDLVHPRHSRLRPVRQEGPSRRFGGLVHHDVLVRPVSARNGTGVKVVTISEDLQEKRDRLLTTAAVTILYVNGPKLRAIVRGDTRSYRVKMDDGIHMSCSCKAGEFGRLCAHLMSVAAVTDGPWKDSEAAA
jgi:hypothetical protein